MRWGGGMDVCVRIGIVLMVMDCSRCAVGRRGIMMVLVVRRRAVAARMVAQAVVGRRTADFRPLRRNEKGKRRVGLDEWVGVVGAGLTTSLKCSSGVRGREGGLEGGLLLTWLNMMVAGE